MKFNRYLVFYGPGEENTGLKGIRSDAPEDIIDEFIAWYRDHNRYENGRLRPEGIVRRSVLIDVSASSDVGV